MTQLGWFCLAAGVLAGGALCALAGPPYWPRLFAIAGAYAVMGLLVPLAARRKDR